MKKIIFLFVSSFLFISCASNSDENFIRDYTVSNDFVSKITKNEIYEKLSINDEKKLSMVVSFKSSHTFKSWKNYSEEMAWAVDIRDKITLKGYDVNIFNSNDNIPSDIPRLNIDVKCQTPNCRCSGFHKKGLVDNVMGKGFLFKRIKASITDSTGKKLFSKFDGYGPEACTVSVNKKLKIDELIGQLDKVFY